MVHKGKDCLLKNQQEGALTIPEAAKAQVNPNYHSSSDTSNNANTIQSFQAILEKLLLEQDWLAGPAWLMWLLLTYFASDPMAKLQSFKDTIFSIYVLLLPPIFSIFLVHACIW